MKNVIKVLILVMLVVGTYFVVDFIISRSDNTLAIPDLTAESTDFGKVEDVKLEEAKYVVEKQLLSSSHSFIDQEVNAQIENEASSLVSDSDRQDKVKENQKGVYKNMVETYQVTDTIVSVKVTSMTKPVSSEHYTKLIHLYNYDLGTKKAVKLEDLFNEGYKTRIQNIYTDSFLLKKTGMEFYTGIESASCAYSVLKDYVKKEGLTMANLEMSEADYSALFEPKTNQPLTTATVATEATTDTASEDPSTDTTEKATDTTEKATEKKTEQGSTARAVVDTGKMIAFTFDDGPHKSNTDQILALLAQYGAHATFFMQGCNASYYPDVVKRVYESGNEIGNHTWDHANLKKSSVETIHQQVDDAANEIKSIIGVRPTFVRPPYGAVNDTVREEVAEPMIYWSVDSLDWDSRDPDQIVPLVLSEVEDGDIVLFHDIHATTIPAIERLLPELISQGYTIVSVGELMAARGVDIYSKEVWYSVPAN